MQSWGIRKGSSLCVIDKQVFGSCNHLGLTKDTNNGALLINLHGSDPRSLDYHWRTPSYGLGGTFGLAYYDPNYPDPQIFKFNDTNRISNDLQFIYESKNGIAGYNRTTLLVLAGDITIEDGTFNAIINRIILIIGLASFITAGIMHNSYFAFASAISIVTLGAAFGEAHLKLSDTGLLIIFLIALHGFAFAVSYCLRTYMVRRLDTFVGILLVLIQTGFAAANYRRSWEFIACATLMVAMPLFIGVRMHLLTISKVLYTFGGIGCFFAVSTLSIPVVAIDYPAAYYLEALSNRRRYTYMTVEERFNKAIYGLIISVGLLIAELLAVIVSRHKIIHEFTKPIVIDGYFATREE